jgi:hypothetical protein
VKQAAEDDLQQRDLSHLTVAQMSAAERAELRRRYDAFVATMGHRPPIPGKSGRAARSLRRWMPPKVR